MSLGTIFFLEGNVPAKKNSRQCFVKNGRMINIPSKRYKEWHNQAMWQLEGFGRLKPPYELICTFYFKDNRKRDLDNALASICDLLQDAGIIDNDNWQDLRSVKAIAGGVSKEAPRVKVEIHSKNA